MGRYPNFKKYGKILILVVEEKSQREIVEKLKCSFSTISRALDYFYLDYAEEFNINVWDDKNILSVAEDMIKNPQKFENLYDFY